MRKNALDLLGRGAVAVGLCSLVGLYAVSRYSYPLFHTIAELFSIIIGFSLFMLIWNARRIIDNHYLIFISIAYFFVAVIDLIHTLAYKGISFFAGYGTNLPTQLWIAARYIESLSLLAAPFFLRRKLHTGWTLAGYAALTVILLTSAFTGAFPDCYRDGIGLTRFKIVSEYLISTIFLCSLLVLIGKRNLFDQDMFTLLALSIVASIGSEMALTFYVGVFDFSNLLGHYLKIIAFYLIYKAVIETGLSRPYDLMFRNLKQQEAVLRESEEKYHSLFDNMLEGFALHEMVYNERGEPCDYRILDVNPAFEALTGLKRDRIIGRLFTEVLPGEDPRWIKLFGEGTMTGKPIHFEEYSLVLKRHYEVSVYRTAPRHFAVIFMDITDRKQVEIELKKHAVLLEEANKEMEGFSYSISHDLRAPLRAIDGYARMIMKRKADGFDEETRRQFKLIRDNTAMMGQLIDDVLAFSGLGKQAMVMSKIDMGQLFRGVWEELRTSDPDRRINLKMDELPPAMGDYRFIKQVVANILANAIKFTKDRNMAIIEVKGYTRENENVYCVRDNGAGFDMQYYNKLFVVFQRLHSNDDFEGTGVGLAIVQRIVQRHGGRVWAEGELGRGACFFFTLQRA